MTKQNAAALITLMGQMQSDTFTKEYWNARDNLHATFEQHPFGQDVTLQREGGLNHQVVLVAEPGITDLSVKGMLLMLQYELASKCVDEMQFRLRITRVQIDRDRDDKSRYVHELYFELVTWVGTFICAGCNDCTGEGGAGGRDLEEIFNLVGRLCDVPVEEVVIPFGRCEEIHNLFRDTYHRFYVSKHAAE